MACFLDLAEGVGAGTTTGFSLYRHMQKNACRARAGAFFEVRRVRAAICFIQTPAVLPHFLARFRYVFSGQAVLAFLEFPLQTRPPKTKKSTILAKL